MGKSWVGLVGIFLFVLLARLFFAFQTPFFTSDDAYLHVRYVEHILQTGTPLWDDPLGYGGRTLVLSPLFDYILAFFALFIPSALKIMPNIFASLIVFPVYLIAFHLTRKHWIALFSALLGGFVPVFFANTINQVSPLSLAIPLFIFLVYAWLRVPKRSWVLAFLGGLLFFVFLHPLSLVLVLGIVVYVGLAMAERFKQSLAELELALFSLFFTLWAQFLLYKKLILFHGPAVIWQNIPSQLLSEHFAQVTVLGALWQVGVLPLVGGTYVLYKYVFREHQRDAYVLFSFSAAVFGLLWLKLLDVETGLMLLGVFLVLLFSDWLLILMDFVRQTKAAKYRNFICSFCMLLVFLTSVLPAFTEAQAVVSKTITAEEVASLKWLNQNTPINATILAPANYGNYISAIAGRRNVVDSYFLLRGQANERLSDVNRVFRTVLETEAVSLFDKYNANYLFVPPDLKDIGFSGSPCFKRVYSANVRIYEKNPKCHMRVVS